MMGISPSTTWTCLSKFKCSVWSFVVEVPAKCDDQVAQKPSLQPPTSARDPCATCCKRTSTTNELEKISALGDRSPRVQSDQVPSAASGHSSWRFPSSATTSGAKVPSSLSVVTRARSYRPALGPPAAAPSGPPRTSAAAAPVTQNTPSGHSNRHNDSLIKVNAPGPRPGSQSRRT